VLAGLFTSGKPFMVTPKCKNMAGWARALRIASTEGILLLATMAAIASTPKQARSGIHRATCASMPSSRRLEEKARLGQCPSGIFGENQKLKNLRRDQIFFPKPRVIGA
jgi:hypothetical protein